MASNNNDRPLLVVHDDEKGHLVYDLLLLDDGEAEEPALACFPRPVAHFAASLRLRALAVSGGAVLGAFYDLYSDTLIHDTVVDSGRPRESVRWPNRRSFTASRYMWTGPTNAPAMIPMADGTVIRLDRALFNGHYAFEELRPVVVSGGGGVFHAIQLPKPPIVYRDGGEELVWISAYFALGTRVWIAAPHKGTFSFDAGDRTWRKEGRWELPFEGRALYVPELGSVIGLAAGTRLLCAYDFVSGKPPVMRHVWTETYPEGCIYTAGDDQRPSRPRDVPSLAYLGHGRFCICRPMSVMEPEPDNFGPPMKYNAASFLVVLLRRSAATGELELIRRGKTSYMCCSPKSKISYLGFIQPATT